MSEFPVRPNPEINNAERGGIPCVKNSFLKKQSGSSVKILVWSVLPLVYPVLVLVVRDRTLAVDAVACGSCFSTASVHCSHNKQTLLYGSTAGSAQ